VTGPLTHVASVMVVVAEMLLALRRMTSAMAVRVKEPSWNKPDSALAVRVKEPSWNKPDSASVARVKGLSLSMPDSS
jgi:hypothetical protein